MDYSSAEVSTLGRCGVVMESSATPHVASSPRSKKRRASLRVARSVPFPWVHVAEGLRSIRFSTALSALAASGRGRCSFLRFYLFIVALHCGEELVVKYPSFAK